MYTIKWKDAKNKPYTTSSRCMDTIKVTVNTLRITGMKVLSVTDADNKRVSIERN